MYNDETHIERKNNFHNSLSGVLADPAMHRAESPSSHINTMQTTGVGYHPEWHGSPLPTVSALTYPVSNLDRRVKLLSIERDQDGYQINVAHSIIDALANIINPREVK